MFHVNKKSRFMFIEETIHLYIDSLFQCTLIDKYDQRTQTIRNLKIHHDKLSESLYRHRFWSCDPLPFVSERCIIR